MLSFFRRLSNSKIGTWIVAAIGLAILVGFAVADLSNFGTGNIGFGTSSGALAKVGNQTIDEREMSDAMQRRLQAARQQQPTADYATIIGDFNPVLEALLEDKALLAFADKYGFPLSKRLIDAEIAAIPAAKGFNGQFSEQAYAAFLAQQRLSDAQVRQLLAGGLAQRLLLTPVVTNARVPLGMATPYASMLLEARQGEGAIIPAEAFKAGLTPTETEWIIEICRAINARGIAILLIEHVMRAVMALSRRVVVLSQGEVLAAGAPDAMARDPRVVEAYLGEAYDGAVGSERAGA